MMANQTINSFNVDGVEYDIEDTAGRARGELAYKLAYDSDQLLSHPEPEWVAHRNIYRGKNLGSSLTEEQKSHIEDGTFEDMYVGDYWEAGDNKWRIADINYWLNVGSDSGNLLKENHLVIVPDKALYKSYMNEESDTSEGYLGSYMYKTGLEQARRTIESIFGSSNILSHKEYLSNKVTNNYESGGAWVDSTIEIPSQIMLVGSRLFPMQPNISAINHTVDKVQLSLFRLKPSLLNNATYYWTRDAVSNTNFAGVDGRGRMDSFGAKDANCSVRPVFGIIGTV